MARQEAARIKVAAGQQGLNIGGSVEAMLRDSLMQNNLATERINLNAETQDRAAIAEANSMHSRNTRPTILGAGLRVAVAGGQAYMGGKSLQIARSDAAKGPR